MSLTFKSLDGAAGLKQLEAYLVGRTFVFGLCPSTADADLLALVKKCPDANTYPASARWFNYISGFDAKAQKGFAKCALLSVGVAVAAPAAKPAAKAAAEDDDDDDDDMFDDDEEEEEEDPEELAKIEAAKKKKKKRKPVLRSQIIFDIKPMSIEVDLEEMADKIKDLAVGTMEPFATRIKDINDERVTVENSCVWGEGHEVKPIAFGICKLQVSCVVNDDVVGTDDVKDFLEAQYGDLIQSIDVAAMNKATALK
jgi:elongation factor 1-beta